MHAQPGLRKGHLLKKFILGIHPIIQHFIEKLRITEIIGTHVQSDKRRKVDTENVLCLLIHNYLTSPSPLYEIQDWIKPLDIRNLGISSDEIEFIYDERVARALDSFYNSRHTEVFFQLALRAIKIFELDCSQIHNDTTTVTFSGKHADWNAGETLAYGHNKDHRPDLKQLVLGLTVTADGAVPLLHEIYDGNKTDDQTHILNHKRLQKLLSCTDFIYVADSKLSSETNLKKIDQWGGLFISVMPRTWKEDGQFRKIVIDGTVKWKPLLSRPNNREPKSKVDYYELAEGKHQTKQGYRLCWIRSSQKAEQDFETRMRNNEKALDELRFLQTKLNKYSLKTEAQIELKIKTILKEYGCMQFIHYAIHAHKEQKNIYKERGRPGTSTKAKQACNILYSISFSPNVEAIEEESKTDGIFPLISNLDTEKYPPKEILEIYKFQPFLEKRYSQLKTYQNISPVYLKDGKRCVAFLHMQVMALMVASLIERTLRLAMEKKGIKTLPIYPEGRACKSPTMFDLVRLFRDVERYEITQSEEVAIYPAKLGMVHKEVLKLLGIPLSSYQ
jgi:transposase